MKSLTRIRGLFCFSLSFASAPALASADWLFYNGTILTMDAERPVVEALAVEGKKITALGTYAGVQKQVGKSTRRFDLKGKTLLPGFVESHGHLYGLGRKLLTLDLAGMTSREAVLEAVAKEAAKLPAGSWLVGRGWDQNLWPDKVFPTKEQLATISPQNPVFLSRVDGHAAWVNPLALNQAGITAQTRDPDGGRILRNNAGEPSGILIDEAMDLVARVMPAAGRAETIKTLQAGMAAAAAAGITFFHDAGTSSSMANIYEELASSKQLPLRVYAMLSGGNKTLLQKYFARGPLNFDDHLMIRAVKLMADGALGSRGAALLADYADEPGNQGLAILSEKEVLRVTEKALAAGYQVSTHAIGDRANQTVLNAYERALVNHRGPNPRLRMEHAQIVAPSDLERFANLGIIASVQPTHCTSDSPWAIKRLGEERFTERAYLWRRFLNAGVHISAGSDAPVESVDPLLGLYAFVTRQNAAGEPSGGWNPREKLTLGEALYAYTVEGAYAGFMEEKLGRLKRGYLADLVVLSRDLKQLKAPRELLQTKVVLTMVGGKVIYDGHPRAP